MVSIWFQIDPQPKKRKVALSSFSLHGSHVHTKSKSTVSSISLMHPPHTSHRNSNGHIPREEKRESPPPPPLPRLLRSLTYFRLSSFFRIREIGESPPPSFSFFRVASILSFFLLPTSRLAANLPPRRACEGRERERKKSFISLSIPHRLRQSCPIGYRKK